MYAKIKNSIVIDYPYDINNLKNENPNTSFPSYLTDALLASFDISRVIVTGKPVFDPSTQGVKESLPEFVEGKWKQKWMVYSLSKQEKEENTSLKAKEVREQRNQLLKDSDWTQVADSPVSKEVWAAYRQALRDISKQGSFPWQVQWPTQP